MPEIQAYKLLPLLDKTEMQNLQLCSVLDLGHYPLPHYMMLAETVYKSEADEI